MAWTTPADQTTGTLITAAIYNAQIIDNLVYLHGDAGAVALGAQVNFGDKFGSVSFGGDGTHSGWLLADTAASATFYSVCTSATGASIASSVAGDSTDFRFVMRPDGQMAWGPGTGARDTTLARTTTGVLALTSGKGLGYGVGTGGSVTQATSKATGVTLNTACGQITMNNAALAAGASVTFNVTNNIFAVTDVVVASISSSLTTSFLSYRLDAPNNIGGSPNPTGFQLRLTNVSAGSLSEAVVINFAIIKAAAS